MTNCCVTGRDRRPRPGARRVALPRATAALALLAGVGRGDSDEYSADAFLESGVTGINVTSVVTVRSPHVGSIVLVVSGLSGAAIDLGGVLPVLHVGPPYVTFNGAISLAGKFAFSYQLGALYPPGTPLRVQALVATPGGLVVGSNTVLLKPGGPTASWSNGTGLLPPSTAAFGGGDVDWADLDKNGYFDGFVANVGDAPIPSLLMNGSGGLVDEAASRLPAEALVPSVCVELADVDRDGYADVFLGTGPDPGAPLANQLLWNDGAASFSADPLFPPGTGLAVDAEFGDVDGDEDLDLFVVAAIDPEHMDDTPQPATFYRQTAGAFDEVNAFSNLPGNDPLVIDGDVSLGDVDNDGDLDVFVASSGPQGGGAQNQMYRNDGLGGFTNVTASALPVIEDSSFEADFLDFNQDGLLDIFVANSVEGLPGVNMLFNLGPPPDPPGAPHVFIDGGAIFLSPFPPSTNIRLACDIADVDADGDQDIGVGVHHLFGAGGQPEGEAFLLLNQGGAQGGITGQYLVDVGFGTFGTPFVPGDLTFVDVDNDGDSDCYVSSNGDLLGSTPEDVLLVNEL